MKVKIVSRFLHRAPIDVVWYFKNMAAYWLVPLHYEVRSMPLLLESEAHEYFSLEPSLTTKTMSQKAIHLPPHSVVLTLKALRHHIRSPTALRLPCCDEAHVIWKGQVKVLQSTMPAKLSPSNHPGPRTKHVNERVPDKFPVPSHWIFLLKLSVFIVQRQYPHVCGYWYIETVSKIKNDLFALYD